MFGCGNVLILGFSAYNCNVENFMQEHDTYGKNLLVNAVNNQPIAWQQLDAFRLDDDD